MKMSLWCVNIALTKGCTRKCGFCGIHNLPSNQKNKHLHMSMGMVDKIISDIKEVKEKLRVEFSLFGEPTLHPEIYEVIRRFRERLPKVQLSIVTNGDVIQRGKVSTKLLFESGLDYLMVDYYERSKVQSDKLLSELQKADVKIYDYHTDKKSIWAYNRKEQAIIIVDDLKNTQDSATRKYHTVGGNMPKEVWSEYGIDESIFPVEQRCGKIFTEIVVDYDGIVPFCCLDWNRKNILGDLNKDSIKSILESEKLSMYQYLIYEKKRGLVEVCSQCNNRTQRTGLIEIEKYYPELLELSKDEIKSKLDKL